MRGHVSSINRVFHSIYGIVKFSFLVIVTVRPNYTVHRVVQGGGLLGVQFLATYGERRGGEAILSSSTLASHS